MADLIIKPNSAVGDKLIIQDRASGAVLTIEVSKVTVSGDMIPSADSSHDLGSATKQWQNIYTGDLHLKNERGSWTVIEEENYLTLRNNKTDKVYKLVMEEIE